MKLDYLQFLELETFTRFGAHLEASMERIIRRGRALREILKQDQLAPLAVEFQLAWMVAFNDGMFDDTDIEQVAGLLTRIESGVSAASLTLDSPREEWSRTIAMWLKHPPEHAT